MGISDPVESASMAFFSCLQSSAVLQASIFGQSVFSPTAHFDILDSIRHEAWRAYLVCFIGFVILGILVYTL